MNTCEEGGHEGGRIKDMWRGGGVKVLKGQGITCAAKLGAPPGPLDPPGLEPRCGERGGTLGLEALDKAGGLETLPWNEGTRRRGGACTSLVSVLVVSLNATASPRVGGFTPFLTGLLGLIYRMH